MTMAHSCRVHQLTYLTGNPTVYITTSHVNPAYCRRDLSAFREDIYHPSRPASESNVTPRNIHYNTTMPIKTILFDFMGTCLDWHSHIVSTPPSALPEPVRSSFALEWRQAYFDANTSRLAQNLPPEDIDLTHARTWDEVISRDAFASARSLLVASGVKEQCIKAWHHQPAWLDVAPTLETLRNKGYEIVVHANGTTRLQLDLCRSSNLSFNMLFSSQMLEVYKPALRSYTRVLELLQRKPEECVMVAAHAYDLRGAKMAGMKTVYVYRWTDDVREDQEVVRQENEVWLEDMRELGDVIERLE
jgi:2-haloalkanoic acid dehalogenase type II